LSKEFKLSGLKEHVSGACHLKLFFPLVCTGERNKNDQNGVGQFLQHVPSYTIAVFASTET